MIYPYLVLHMRSLGLSVEEVSTGRFLCSTPTLSSTWALLDSLWRRSVLGGSEDHPYLVLHMRSLVLSVEEVRTGRFLCSTINLSSTCALLASLWRRSVLECSDDLPLPCPPHALSWPLCGGGQYWEVLMIYCTLSSTCALLASPWRRSLLGDFDDLPLPCPPHAFSRPLCGGGQN
jgi:hypothetical protein